MAKKYSYSSKIINSTKEDLINKIAYIKNSDDIKNNYLNEINKLETALNNQALVISNIRHNYIELIENKIACELKDLYLNNASFKIKITTTNYNINGQDHIEFMFSANKGTTIKPLAQVASGGELSRLLLALKTIQINNQNTLFIFDEIDSGVSGEVADAIGKKMSSLAQKNDIIAITHLPQVAIYAKNHLYISKSITKDMTTSNYEYLSDDRIVNQIAKMISGDNISDSAIIHAQELLKNANK
jgi:DNA repair protein RecN (Recombination protein N)